MMTPLEENNMESPNMIYIGVLNYRDYSFKLFEVKCDDTCNFNAEEWLNDNEELTGYRETYCYWISSKTPIRYEFISNKIMSTIKK